MSFSAKVKDELCRLDKMKPCCIKSELYGALLFCNTFKPSEIKVITEHQGYAARLPGLLRLVFGFGWDKSESKSKHVLSLTDPSKCLRVWDMYSFGQEHALHLNNAVFDGDCCLSAFWRGAFLSGGTVTDPGKGYHLQLSTPHYHLVRELMALFNESNMLPKNTVHDGVYSLYFKASESIEDFLTLCYAPHAAITVMEAKVEKDLRNVVNRKVNCETANVTKTVKAAMDQCEALMRLKSSPKWDTLDETLKLTAEKRLEHPEYPLSELAAALDPPIGRSGLNHRLRKLMTLAGENM